MEAAGAAGAQTVEVVAGYERGRIALRVADDRPPSHASDADARSSPRCAPGQTSTAARSARRGRRTRGYWSGPAPARRGGRGVKGRLHLGGARGDVPRAGCSSAIRTPRRRPRGSSPTPAARRWRSCATSAGRCTARSPTRSTLARVGELVCSARDAGLDASLKVEGEPVALPSGMELAGFRVVQEALTNALKHAGPARADVRIGYEPWEVVLEITDDGAGGHADSELQRAGGGHGTVGMRERVGLYGGSVEAGPGPAGGFRVHARMPVPRTAVAA